MMMRFSWTRLLAAFAPFAIVLICNTLLAARRVAEIGCFGCVEYEEQQFADCTGSIRWYLQNFKSFTPLQAQKKVFDEGTFKCPDPDTHRLFPSCYSAIRRILQRDQDDIGFKRAQQLVYGNGDFICPDPDWDLKEYPDCGLTMEGLMRTEPSLIRSQNLQKAQALAALQQPAGCPPAVDSSDRTNRYPDCAGAIKWMMEKYSIESGDAQAKVFLEGTGKCPWPEHLTRESPPQDEASTVELRGRAVRQSAATAA
jgi:hypothetical protein